MGKQSSHSKRGERAAPSLYENAGAGGAAASSILADLEPSRGGGKRRGWVAALLVLAVTGIAGYAYFGGTEAGPAIAVTPRPSLPVTAQALSPEPLQTGPANVVLETDTQAAAPPDLPPLALADAESRPAAQAAPVINEVREADPPPLNKAESAEPRKNAVQEKRNAQPVKQKAAAPKQKPAAKQASQTKPAKQQTAARKREQKREQKPAGDHDVDLIAALLSHVSQPTGIAGKAAAGPSPRSGNRDVVLRNPGEATDTLLQRCRNIGDLEGILCRERICTGLWGKDPSCPAMPQRE